MYIPSLCMFHYIYIPFVYISCYVYIPAVLHFIVHTLQHMYMSPYIHYTLYISLLLTVGPMKTDNKRTWV